MQEAKIILNSKLTHGNKGVNFVTSFRADQGDCRMHVPIKAQMNELVQNPPASGPCEVMALSKRRWMIESEAGPIAQLELLDDDVTALVYAMTARHGGGPQYFPAKVQSITDDGNFELRYADGDWEASVRRYRIRRPGEKERRALEEARMGC